MVVSTSIFRELALGRAFELNMEAQYETLNNKKLLKQRTQILAKVVGYLLVILLMFNPDLFEQACAHF